MNIKNTALAGFIVALVLVAFLLREDSCSAMDETLNLDG